MPGYHVLGAGSIGMLFAQHLRQSSLPVTLLVKDSRAVKHQRQTVPIQLERTFRGARELLVSEARVERVSQAAGPIQDLLVCTKSLDVARAVKSVQHRLTPDSTVYLLQNGLLAVYQELWQQVLGTMDRPPHVVVGSVTHGCYLTGPFSVMHAGQGSCALAQVDPHLPTLEDPRHQDMWSRDSGPGLKQLLSIEPLSVSLAPSHQLLLQQLLQKLVVNCCINPLTGLLGCCNGHLAQAEHTRSTMHAVCAELHALYGPQLGLTLEELYDLVLKVATSTSSNRSSMLQDISAGRLTEVEYLSGYAAKQGAARQVAMPVNQTLYQLIKAKEQLGAVATARVARGDGAMHHSA